MTLHEERGEKKAGTGRRLEEILGVMERQGYRGPQLVAYLRWVFTAPAKWPSWMRKPGRPYLEVDNLLRISHLQKHLPEAERWAQAQAEDQPVVVVYGDRVFTG